MHRGAAFTRRNKPTGRLLKRLGTLDGNEKGDGPERDETLRWMHKLGPDRVRGWKFVRGGKLTKGELQEIEDNIRELFDLCRICGKDGHFAAKCPLRKKKKDQQQKAVKTAVVAAAGKLNGAKKSSSSNNCRKKFASVKRIILEMK